MTQTYLLNLAYLAASILFILGLRDLSSPQTARRGMLFAEIGMLLAVVGTLLRQDIVKFEWIVAGLIIGSLIGAAMAIFMPMTAMPQRIALSHSFGALAATLVGIVKYNEHLGSLDGWLMSVVGFEVLLGSLTITGSLMAFGKLQGIVKSVPITYPFQNLFNISLFVATVGLLGFLIFNTTFSVLFYLIIAAGLTIGVLIVLPIGGADMPVVLALLNSYAGLAAASTGFVINNNVLIIAGILDGASGFMLSMLMSKAMNRSFANVLFGAVGAVKTSDTKGEAERIVTHYTPEDLEYVLSNANSLIIVPGYGLAVAQAQHALGELAQLLIKRGVLVRFAIHPVAGRMPGHMNVLLAEANIPYDLLCEPDQINDDFQTTDVALVVGANDVVNPAARYKKDSPLYGMQILNADQAREVVVLKRTLNPGFAGEDNEIFYNQKTMMVFGDAKETLTKLLQLLKTAEESNAKLPVTA